MESTAPATNLLEQLDNRQNQVLDELDRLNDQIVEVIAAWQEQGDHVGSDSDSREAA